MFTITPELLKQLDVSIPRYTSYPTAPTWNEFSSNDYATKIENLQKKDSPFSLYVHIPFCKTMCLFCGCSVILNRKEETEIEYVNALCTEIKLLTKRLGKKKISQLHFGGGTPTKLSMPLLKMVFETLQNHFDLDLNEEIAIEIDPRTVMEDQGAKLKFLKTLGFNRVSFGVQDTNEAVQKAIGRHQSWEMTYLTATRAKELGFQGVNIDLIYGLPLQTIQSFSTTVTQILSLKPDRIALFSYAKVPWLKPHQRAISETSLPTTEEKFAIYSHARSAFIENGYVPIGMDHFALPHDELAKSYFSKTLQRNFQGYTVRRAENQIGLGVTAIGGFETFYVQNEKTLSAYYERLKNELLPVAKGKILSKEDQIRKKVIQTLMCDFYLDKSAVEKEFNLNFDPFFFAEIQKLESLIELNLLKHLPAAIEVTPLGELFIRNIASCFDSYLTNERQFSKSI